jgi:hypothetical protein
MSPIMPEAKKCRADGNPHDELFQFIDGLCLALSFLCRKVGVAAISLFLGAGDGHYRRSKSKSAGN